MSPTIIVTPSSPRFAAWLKVCPDRQTSLGIELPVLSLVPVRGDAPGVSSDFFRVDLRELTAAEIERVVMYVSHNFNLSKPEATRLLNDPDNGLPVLADEHAIAPPIGLRHFI